MEYGFVRQAYCMFERDSAQNARTINTEQPKTRTRSERIEFRTWASGVK